MNRRVFLEQAAGTTAGLAWLSNRSAAATGGDPVRKATAAIDPALAKDWLARWERNILSDARNRYCDRETGEEIGWLISPFLNGFYQIFISNHDPAGCGGLAATPWFLAQQATGVSTKP